MIPASTSLRARIFVPDSSFVPRGRWAYASSIVSLPQLGGYCAYFVDIPALSFSDAIDFAGYETLLGQQIFVDDSTLLQSVRQAVSLLKSYVIEHLERKGIYLDVRASFGVVCVHNDTLYAGGLGRFCLGVYREDAFYELMQGNDDEVTTVSGMVQNEDMVSSYVATYPVEELCMQIAMEDEQQDTIYRAYINTFPSRGVASLLLLDQSTELEKTSVAAEELLSDMIGAENSDQVETSLSEVQEDVGVEYEEDTTLDEGVTVRRSSMVARFILRMFVLTERLFKRIRGVIWQVLLPVVQFLDHKKLVYVGVAFAVALNVMVFAGTPYEKVWQSTRQIDAAKASSLPPLQTDLAEVRSLMETSPVRASRMLVKLRSDMQDLPEGVRSSEEGRTLIEEVENLYAQSIKAVRADAQLFFDISTVGEDATVSTMSLVGESLLVADTKKDAVYRVDTSTRASRAVLGTSDGIGGSIDVVSDEMNIYSLSQQGIIRIGHTSSEVEKVLERDSRWQNVVRSAIYGGNMYVFDTESTQVWKYTSTASGFDGGTGYIAQDAQYSLSTGVDIAIDGYVWLGLSDGNVVRMAQGRIDSFSLESLTNQLTRLTAISVPENHDFLYVLDGDQGRVVQYRKETGGFVQQYVHDSLKGARDFVVNAETKTLYFAKDSLIYRFNLQ